MENKKEYSVILLSWICLLFITLVTGSGIVSGITIFYTGLLPFLLFVFWFSTSSLGRSIREKLGKWHWAVIFSWVLGVYALFAQRWTSVFLNEIFYVDGGSLGITNAVLAVLFTPFAILYSPSVVNGLWSTMIFVGMLWGGLLPLALLLPISFKKVLKIFGVSAVLLFLTSFFLGTISNLSNNIPLLTKRFALWADFNSNHLCTDKWAEKSDSVLFLGGDRVLVYTPSRLMGSQFHPEKCNFGKDF